VKDKGLLRACKGWRFLVESIALPLTNGPDLSLNDREEKTIKKGNRMNKPWDYLIKEAAKARENAYAPYSHFKVGAAVEGESGKIYTGCNVENASYGLSMCAERTAICNAISQGEKVIKAIAIVTSTTPLTPPCGACRQFIQEFGQDAVIVLANQKGEEKVFTQGNLLPSPFDGSSLRR